MKRDAGGLQALKAATEGTCSRACPQHLLLSPVADLRVEVAVR
jgi:hypothetical protein